MASFIDSVKKDGSYGSIDSVKKNESNGSVENIITSANHLTPNTIMGENNSPSSELQALPMFNKSSTSIRSYTSTTTPMLGVNNNQGGWASGIDTYTANHMKTAMNYSAEEFLASYSRGEINSLLDEFNQRTNYKYEHAVEWMMKPFKSPAYDGSVESVNSIINGNWFNAYKDIITEAIDNSIGLPFTYETDYSTIDDVQKTSDTLNSLRRSLHLYDRSDRTSKWYWEQYCANYNRFKVATTNDLLARGFGHVFFTKPDCNIFSDTAGDKLSDVVINKSLFVKAWNNSPTLLHELSKTSHFKTFAKNPSHFMFSLSNRVNNFSVNEDYIGTGVTGKTYTGHQISYGKTNIESKSTGTLTLEFTDDRSLHVYELIRLWLEYISGVYRGSILPTQANIKNRIIDYASSIYYFITDESGENIIYWEKYYGIFPTNISNDALAWTNGTTISNPKFSVTFQYSFRSSFDTEIFTEFNYNAWRGSAPDKINFVPIYDKKLMHAGDSWVGVPYVQTVQDDISTINAVVIKGQKYLLRFTEPVDGYEMI